MTKRFVQGILFLALIAIFPNFQSQLSAANEIQKPEVITGLKLSQSGPGQLTANWQSTWQPPYYVTVVDATLGGVPVVTLVQVNTNSYTLGGLTPKHNYIVTVMDNDGIMSQMIFIN